MASNPMEETAGNGRYQFQLSQDLLDKVDTGMAKGGYASKAEFIRAAIREKLEKMGLQ